MDLISNPEVELINAKVIKAYILLSGDLVVAGPAMNKDYKIFKVSKDLVILGENTGDEIVFMDALEIVNPGSLDAMTREALREHRQSKGQIVNILQGLHGRQALPIPKTVHAVYWGFIL